MKTLFKFISFSVLFLVLSISCNKESSTETPEEPLCGQECQDEHVAYGMVDIFWFIWNQNIAGQPVGPKDFTVPGPQGGTIHVTGNTEVSTSTGINTLHLVLDLSNCKGLKERYNLTFNGSVTADGTFSISHKAITYASSMLIYTGTVGKDNYVTQVSSSCNATINETQTSVSGTMCGRTFSY